jgi:hypothetical protein
MNIKRFLTATSYPGIFHRLEAGATELFLGQNESGHKITLIAEKRGQGDP